MTVGALHRASLVGTPTLALLTVVGGSALLAGAGAALVLVLVFASRQLLDAEHSRTRTWITHGLTVVILLLALSLFRTARIDAVLLIVMLGVFNRFVLRQGARDDFIIVGASTVLLAAGTTVTPGVGFALLLMLFLPVLLWALWTSTILGAADRSARRGPTLRALAARPVPRQRLYIAATSLALMLAGYAVVSLFPRYHFGRFFSAGYFMSLPGASNSMTLGTGGVGGGDTGAVALRVEPNPDAPRPLLDGLYARMYVLDRFDGQTWSTSPEKGRFALYPRKLTYKGGAEIWEREDGPETVKVIQERVVPRDRPHPIVTLGRLRPSYVKVRYPQQSFSGEWTARFRRTAVKLVYKVDLAADSPVQDLPRHLLTDQAERLVQLPDALDPRVRSLAASLTEGQADDRAKIRAVLAHFDRGFTYSLDPLEGEEDDPLVRFLFEAKQGHCELYAGAVATLLRASGVRARVATGYYGGWWNSSGGYLEFGSADAHAWVEAFDAARGWVWLDATPESLRARRKDKSFAWLVDLYDAIEAAWFDNIIDFDDRKRRALLGVLADKIDTLGQEWPGFGELSGDSGGGSRASGAGWVAIVALLLLLGGGLAWLRSRRGLAPEELGRRLRRALAADAAAHEPLGALLSRVPGEVEPEARRAVRDYEALRFDAPERAPDPREVADAVRELERALAQRRAA